MHFKHDRRGNLAGSECDEVSFRNVEEMRREDIMQTGAVISKWPA